MDKIKIIIIISIIAMIAIIGIWYIFPHSKVVALSNNKDIISGDNPVIHAHPFSTAPILDSGYGNIIFGQRDVIYDVNWVMLSEAYGYAIYYW